MIFKKPNNSAFEQGRKAYYDGLESWSNPYSEEDYENSEKWLSGYIFAQNENEHGDYTIGHVYSQSYI